MLVLLELQAGSPPAATRRPGACAASAAGGAIALGSGSFQPSAPREPKAAQGYAADNAVRTAFWTATNTLRS